MPEEWSMRVGTVTGILLVLGAATLSAQHAHQFEVNAFAGYTRYDRAFGLNSQIGGGGRLGYFLNEYLGLEVEASVTRPGSAPWVPVIAPTTQVRFGSVSLVLNSGGEHNVLYVLGGYSRLDMGVNPPYNFALNGVHGAIGDRIVFGQRFALRLEGRAFYAPSNTYFGGSAAWHAQASAGLSVFLLGARHVGEAPPPIPKAQRDSIIAAGGTPPPEPGATLSPEQRRVGNWSFQWFWGAQTGLFLHQTNFEGYHADPIIGAHWLITAKRTALLVVYEQAFFTGDSHATIIEPSGTLNPGNVAFRDMRRIMIGLLAFPAQKAVQPFAGAGFALMEVLNPTVTCSSCTTPADQATIQEEANNAASKAFVWFMGGVDIRQGKLSLFGHYTLTSSAKDFLILGTTHTIQGGLRYSLGSAKESIADTE